VAVVKLLLEREEIEVNVRSNSGQTPLVAAVCSSHMEVVKALLETKRVHLTGGETEPPLLAAVEIGSLAMVELLLRMEGLDPNASLPHPGAHPLAAAASQGRFEIVERLLRGDLAIDVNFVDSSGCTALDWALNRDDWESQSCDRREAIAELLRSKGALRGQELLSPACSAQPQLQGEGT
jgi:ankyrin repeat protein